jgi:hypothetical protein
MLQAVYDGSLTPNLIATTNDFTHARFLIFDTPNLPDSQGVEIGFVLAVKLPVIGRTIAKDVELPLEVSKGILSSFGIVYIPTEYSEAGYSMYCAFNSAIAIDSFRVYALVESCTLKKACDTSEECLTRIKQLQTQAAIESVVDAALVTNQLAQNAAILALGSGIGAALSPYTAGASLALPPAVATPLLPGTSALTLLALVGA